MAINFLDNIQLNQNQILGARIENVTSDPTSANGGDIIFNSTSGKLKYYDGTSPFSAAGWISLPDGTGIGGSGTVGTIPVFNSASEITDSRLQTSGSGNTQTFLFNTSGTVALKGDLGVSTGGIIDSNLGKGTSGQLLSSTGSAIAWVNAPVSYTKWIAEGSSGQQNVNDGDTYKPEESTIGPGIFAEAVTKSSTVITQPLRLFTKNMTTAAPSAYSTDVLLWGTNTSATTWKVQQTHVDDVPVSAWGQATTSVDMGDNLIIKVLDPVSAQDAATKNYVDNAIVGGFNVKGGFNASTGVTAVAGTNLYTNTALAVGDYYVVTVAGNFFGQASTPLTIGDSVLVQTAAASGNAQESDFAVIQSDTDLATLTTVGLGNVNEATSPDLYGIDVSYSNGTASVGLDIDGLSVYGTSSSYPDDDYLVIYASDDGTAMDKNMKVNLTDLKTVLSVKGTFAGTSASGTSHVFTHNLATYDVIVQVFDNSTKETVYASVDRNSTNQVTVTTAASANIRCVITEC